MGRSSTKYVPMAPELAVNVVNVVSPALMVTLIPPTAPTPFWLTVPEMEPVDLASAIVPASTAAVVSGTVRVSVV